MTLAADTLGPPDRGIVRPQAIKGQFKVSHISETGVILIYISLFRDTELGMKVQLSLDISYELKITIKQSKTFKELRRLLLGNDCAGAPTLASKNLQLDVFFARHILKPGMSMRGHDVHRRQRLYCKPLRSRRFFANSAFE